MSDRSTAVAQTGWIEELEILRGIAVLFVIIHHSRGNLLLEPHPLYTRFFERFGLGVGVDVFFAISGFVIARQLVPALLASDGRVSVARQIANFWVRRAWRLLPSAWLWLGLILLASIFFNRSGSFGTVRANAEAAVAGILQFGNFRFAARFGHAEYGASFVYWSLSLEEQFYLAFPLVILLSRRRLPWVLASVAAVQLLRERTLLRLAFRTDAMALGALIALWQAHKSYWRVEPTWLRHRLVRWFVLLLLLSALGALGVDGVPSVPYNYSFIALVSATLVLFASYDRGYTTLPSPLRVLLRWVGARSYALYLIHVPAFYFTRELLLRVAPPGRSEPVAALVLCFVAVAAITAELNYRYLEQPLRRFGARRVTRPPNTA